MRVTFVMEQHIGHQTYYQNLRRGVEEDRQITATWVPITYAGANQLLEYLPGLPQGLSGTLQGMLQVRRAIAGKEYDVAFFNTQVPAALAARQVRKRPYVLATDITPIQYDSMSHLYGHQADKAGLLATYKHQVNTRLMCGAACLLPWSHWTRDSLIKDYGVDPRRINVVPPGVDLQLWQPGEARREGAPLRILFVGGDLYRKGGATLIEAFRTLPRGSAELHLVTRTQIASEEGIHPYYNMRPNSPELIALYKAADVFVLPTEAEAFGIAAIEASAAGLAVIATAVGGLSDVVKDTESGYLVQPRDSAGLSALLKRMAEDRSLGERMGRAARLRAETLFDAQRNVAQIIRHLHEAADRTSTSTQAQTLS